MSEVRRCISSMMEAESIVLSFTPMCTICFLYLLIIYTICSRGISANTVILSTSVIVLTGVLTSLPSLLFQVVKLNMTYEVKNVLLVTVYYVNGIINPLVYFCFNPRVREQVRRVNERDTRFWRRQPVSRNFTSSVFVTNTLNSSQL